MFETWGNRLVNMIHQLGYGGLFFASFMENLIPPIPSEVIMPLGGYLASIDKMNVVGAMLVCTIGSTLGNLPYYVLGRYLHQDALRSWVSRYGKYVFYKVEYLDDLYDVFQKNDKKIVFIGRFLPGARGFIGLPAGSSGMSFWQFLIYTLAGTAIWSSFLVLLGYYLGQNLDTITTYLGEYEHYMLYIVAICILLRFVYMIYSRNKKT